MKILFVLSVLAFPFSALAAETFLPLGTWQGDGKAVDEKGVEQYTLSESVTISQPSADQLKIELNVSSGGESRDYALTLAFQANGAFVATSEDGSLYAAGSCDLSVCNYAMVPFEKQGGELVINTGSFQTLPNGNLNRLMFVVTPEYRLFQITELKKVK